MKNVLIDTDIIIGHFRNHKPATNLLENLSKENAVFVSVLTVAEVMSGKDCTDVAVRSQVDDFFTTIEKIDVSLDIAKKAAEFRRLYSVPLVDAVIAATAFELNAMIYSRNAKHFGKIKEIEIKIPY